MLTRLKEDSPYIEGLKTEIIGDKIILSCPKHNYVWGAMPPQSEGCAACWKAWYLYDMTNCPEHLRQERLERAYTVARHAAELAEHGKFDFDVPKHATINKKEN